MTHSIAWLDSPVTINVEHSQPKWNSLGTSAFTLEAGSYSYTVEDVESIAKGRLALRLSECPPLGLALSLLVDEDRCPVYPRDIVRTSYFEEHYSAEHASLGAICSDKSTTVSVWAPTATAMSVVADSRLYAMSRNDHGVWQYTLEGDWDGISYQFEVGINGKQKRANDPYAKALTANSKESVIVNMERLFANRPEAKLPTPLAHEQDAIIYEIHVRDASAHAASGIKNKGKYLGLTEAHTATEKGYSTGLSYIHELGVTHVQLLPINDFARVDERFPEQDYNWGYDPLFFQTPEGSYATDVEDAGVRLVEVRNMIDAIHAKDLHVILDVVYNHVFEMETSPFESLVPGYYFRYEEDGRPSNGTGVGNDLASERSMVRSFILDSINYWLTYFQVDGFRFDLMGALDVETVQQIRRRCTREPRPILLLGEGWVLPTVLCETKKANVHQSEQLPGIRFFNDFFRDMIKGDLFSPRSTGFVNGQGRHLEQMPHLVNGSVSAKFGIPFASDITQIVNYVECHDNHTLWDRLLEANSEQSETERKRMHQMATGFTLLSQGIPFLHAGQEWFRTKKGDANSYLSGDRINALDWTQREHEEEAVAFVRAAIHLRKTYKALRLESIHDIERSFHVLQMPENLFGYLLFDTTSDLCIVANPTKKAHRIHLPSTGHWSCELSNWMSESKLAERETDCEYAEIHPYEFAVLVNERKG
ncbi:type I pullulanase [Shouchella shacheensis]|uniref:type I pullulanase n=1 Tax=Shouchella shacheensis TaxID=1649580 RepID=UPI00073FCBDF|nr:type I pullulanase [Shouchella shacheensis]